MQKERHARKGAIKIKYLLLIPIISLIGFAGISCQTNMDQKELKSMAFSHAQLRKLLSLEHASNFPPSESLICTVDYEAAVERKKLILAGKLTNPTLESISIIVWLPFLLYEV